MKFITSLLLTMLLAYTAFLYSTVIPWWGFAIGCFLVGLLVPQKARLSWLGGFLGMLVCWCSLAWYADSANASLLSAKMAQILPLNGSSAALIAVTGLVGAIVGGFAALSGAFLRKKPA